MVKRRGCQERDGAQGRTSKGTLDQHSNPEWDFSSSQEFARDQVKSVPLVEPTHNASHRTLAHLGALPRWVAWQTEGRGAQGKPTKVPYAPDGRKARADAPATWGTRAEAEVRAKQLPRPFGAGGIGIELGDHAGFAIGGIDLDTCRAETGELAPWALEVVGRFGSYTEVSPSGTGAKVFFLFDATDLPALRAIMGTEHGKQFKRKGHGDHPPAIELYLGNRYFAVTDQPLDSSPAELRHVDASTLRWLLTEAGPAFATGAAPGQEKPLTRSGERQTGDSSRSAAAFKIANDVKRAGGAYPDFLAALDTMSDTAAWKAEKGSANGGRELRRTWERAAVNDDELLTESSVADRFAAQAVNRLRYCHDAGSWYEWTGTHWRADRKHAAFTYARRLTGDLAQRAEAKVQAITGKAAFCGGVEKFAQRDERLAVTAEDWDRHPFLLATPDGTVDLHTGQLRPALQADMMTRVAAVAPAEPGTEAPLWRAFLLQATKGDYQLIGFLKRWAGYCLTGDTREHALLFGYGPGGNGKSVFLNTVARIMGDYAAVAAMDTFTATQGDKHPTDLAMLRGARLVTATETEEGRAWAESRIKQMTGGDPISARFMRQDFFTFRPQFKLTIVGNHNGDSQMGFARAGATDEHHVALLGQEPATREITDQSLVNRGTVEPELVHVLGQRQLGGGDLILDRARLLLGDLGRDKVADNLLWLMLAFDGGRDDGVKRRAHAVELQLAHGGEDSGAFHQGPLLRLS